MKAAQQQTNSFLSMRKSAWFSFIVFGLSGMCSVAPAYSAEVNGTSVLRQNLQTEQNILRQTHQENRERALRQQSVIGAAADTNAQTADKRCLKWQSIDVRGLELLSPKEREVVNQAVPTECISVAKLNELSRNISQVFLNKGYFRIRITQSNGQKQQLVWDVAPLRVSKINNKTQLSSKALFPNVEGKPVNIRQLDQGLDQANRLSAHQVSMDIYPDQNGGLVVDVVDQPRKAWSGAVQMDYNGQNSTGRARLQAALNLDNLAGLADSLSVYAGTTTAPNHDQYSRYAGVQYSIPYGYWLFSIAASTGAYRADLTLPNSGLRAKRDGHSWQYSLRADRVFSRGSRHISSFYGRLNRTSVVNDFMNSHLASSSYELSSAALGLTHTAIMPMGVVYLDGQYVQGLSILGASDGENPAINPKFKKVLLSADWTHRHSWKNHAFHFNHSLVLQHASHHLPGVEELGLTDGSAVRGFRDAPLSAERGFYLRQTVAMPMTVKNRLLLKPYLGLDYGRGRYADSAWSGALGGTLGMALQLNSWSVDVAAQAGRLDTNQAIDKTSTEVSAKVKYQF